jgi:hypothetical protein
MYFILIAKSKIIANINYLSALGAGGRKFESCHPDKARVSDSGFLYLHLIRKSL